MPNIDEKLQEMKKANPKAYLAFLTECNKLVSDLNKELREIEADLEFIQSLKEH